MLNEVTNRWSHLWVLSQRSSSEVPSCTCNHNCPPRKHALLRSSHSLTCRNPKNCPLEHTKICWLRLLREGIFFSSGERNQVFSLFISFNWIKHNSQKRYLFGIMQSVIQGYPPREEPKIPTSSQHKKYSEGKNVSSPPLQAKFKNFFS